MPENRADDEVRLIVDFTGKPRLPLDVDNTGSTRRGLCGNADRYAEGMEAALLYGKPVDFSHCGAGGVD